ncbi:MAG: glutamate dehydrogenase (NADP+) [Bacillariaceae sp.]|jgi:glutamate dehydrogenase (NADP+)
MLQDRGDSLQGKRVMITGSGRTARSVAKKCLEYGAIPITMTDTSGHIYEPDGIPEGKLAILNKIKEERGALLGRYIISSTTAEFNHPENLFDIPCDICIPCGAMKELDKAEINALADNGCKFVIEGGQSCVTPSARKVLKKRGLLYGPHTMTMTGPAITYSLGSGATDDDLKREVDRIYNEVKMTATEFNSHRDLYAGSNIAGFLRVAKNMMLHGAV